MRIDLPICGFKQCRHSFDCNCTNKIEYERCEYRKYKDTGIEPEELAELVAAKQDNRLAVLPCKVGDRIYVRDDDGTIYNPRVQGISVAAHGNNTILHLGGYPVTNLWGDRKGIDWFLTREEAEAALKEQTNGTP